MRFVEALKAAGVAHAVGIGDILRERGAALLAEHAAIDACLNDFVTHGLVAFLEGRLDEAENMTVRDGGAIRSIAASPHPKTFRLPAPRYERFPLGRYRMPFNRYHPYAAVIASTGCPFGCAFCPFARTPYRLRDVDDVLANLEAVRRMGIRQVHFADWTFGVNRAHTAALLEGMIGARFGFTWSCLSRVDLVDRDLLALLARAGCALVEFGVESGSQAILDRYRKGTTIAQVRQAFDWCREQRIATLATFILGLPGETPDSLRETLDLALAIDPTFCSFNAASPRRGTELRREAVTAGAIADEDAKLDSSWSAPVFSTTSLAAGVVEAFRRRAIRRFYSRPSYLLRRAMQAGSWVELRNLVENGAALAWRSIRPAGGK